MNVRADMGGDIGEGERAALSRRVVEMARGLGFAAAGIAPAEETRFGEQLRAWLAAGSHGEMDYMARDLSLRLDPRGHLENTRAFIMVADQYAARGAAEDGELAHGRGRIARYARGRDYHGVMKKRLHRLADTLRAEIPGSDFRSFVDTAPVLERELAERAGIGWIAKNTMVINPRLGSYILLGGAATNLPLAPPAEQRRVEDACGTCTRCIDACPTRAIGERGIEATRCISYLTIEASGEMPRELMSDVGHWVYGCDVCQEVCPHNSERGNGVDVGIVNAAYAPRRDSFDLLEMLEWDEAARRGALTVSPMKRATLAMLKRNALVAAGNWLRLRPSPVLLERVRRASLDPAEPELVRATARSVLEALGGAG